MTRDEIAFHYCPYCEVESGKDEPVCWNCGKVMLPIPRYPEGEPRASTAWTISAGTWRAVGAASA